MTVHLPSPNNVDTASSKAAGTSVSNTHPECPTWMSAQIEGMCQKIEVVPCTNGLPSGKELLGKQIGFAVLESYVHKTSTGRQFTVQPGLHVGR